MSNTQVALQHHFLDAWNQTIGFAADLQGIKSALDSLPLLSFPCSPQILISPLFLKVIYITN